MTHNVNTTVTFYRVFYNTWYSVSTQLSLTVTFLCLLQHMTLSFNTTVTNCHLLCVSYNTWHSVSIPLSLTVIFSWIYCYTRHFSHNMSLSVNTSVTNCHLILCLIQHRAFSVNTTITNHHLLSHLLQNKALKSTHVSLDHWINYIIKDNVSIQTTKCHPCFEPWKTSVHTQTTATADNLYNDINQPLPTACKTTTILSEDIFSNAN